MTIYPDNDLLALAIAKGETLIQQHEKEKRLDSLSLTDRDAVIEWEILSLSALNAKPFYDYFFRDATAGTADAVRNGLKILNLFAQHAQ